MRLPRACLAVPLSALVGACGGDPERINGFETRDAGTEDASVTAPLDAGGIDAAARPDAQTPAPDAGDLADAGSTDAVAADSGLVDAGAPADPCAASPGLSDRGHYDRLLTCLRDASASIAAQRSARDRFVSTVLGRGGFPIIEAGEVTFFYVRDPLFDGDDDARTDEDFAPDRRLTPLRVAGAFNGWDADGGLVLQPEPQDVFHLTVALDVANSDRWTYKFIAEDAAGSDVWFSDPLSRRFDYDDGGRISIVAGGTTRGHLELLRGVPAVRLANARDVYVYLPPGYEGSSATYPVLYMHDGNNLFSNDQPFSAPASWEADEVLEAEVSLGNVSAFIIVGIPNNANRRGEYTHVPDDWGGGGVSGGDGDDYADFIVNDLKPRIDGRYRTAPGRASTGVMGSSLGGLISFYIGLQHPTEFRFVGGMSSTLDWGRAGLANPTVVDLYGQATDLPARDQVFYIDSGGGPPTGGCTGAARQGQDNYCSTIWLKDTLVAAGVDTFPDDPNAVPLTPAGVNIMHWWTPDAAHNEAAWQARLHRAFRLFAP